MSDRAGSDLAGVGSAELLERALVVGDPEDDRWWRTVTELQHRTDRGTFDAVAALVDSADATTRLLAVDVLSQYGYAHEKPFLEEALPLFAAACGDSDPRVVASAIGGFGHHYDPRGLPFVLPHAGSEDRGIRFSAAVALATIAGEPPAGEAVDALVRLSTDPEDMVRDWAVFGLGTQLDIDTPAVRDALSARLDDHDPETAAEAAMGLARRGDVRAVAALHTMLADDPSTLAIEAATVLGSPEFLPALRALRDDAGAAESWYIATLDDAISACTPATS
ncbi:HEAT repeat domain-containing protein [Nocardia sp. XZ_19_385]|uniref:HEAT repeat domain-containing protein n=1 Tax=Nocardia sp. XZ_19_385 TaxID=2769488 RepID=UPI0018904CB1|nr:HEAT repeat domain-containing protein [Nocardia sp. XZ_19_385]